MYFREPFFTDRETIGGEVPSATPGNKNGLLFVEVEHRFHEQLRVGQLPGLRASTMEYATATPYTRSRCSDPRPARTSPCVAVQLDTRRLGQPVGGSL